MPGYTYVGEELALFAAAQNWKGYLRRWISPCLGERVLEVGAGIGATTRMLCTRRHTEWVCLEPDQRLLEEMRRSFAAAPTPTTCRIVHGTLETIGARLYDTLLYVDVLEHIEDDAEEMRRAAAHLAPGGRVVILSPAHQWLFTPFDAAIGHFRRYSKGTLRAAMPPDLEEERLIYLDSVGMFASLANKLLLRSAHPTAGQIAVWDRCLVPASRVVDPLLMNTVGKSILGVYRRAPSA